MNDKNNMYEKFAALLRERGLTAADVSAGAKIAKSSLSEWKAGRYVPKIDKIIAIASFFGVPVSYFVDDYDDDDDNTVTNLIAQQMAHNPDLQTLALAAMRCSDDDIRLLIAFATRLSSGSVKQYDTRLSSESVKQSGWQWIGPDDASDDNDNKKDASA